MRVSCGVNQEGGGRDGARRINRGHKQLFSGGFQWE